MKKVSNLKTIKKGKIKKENKWYDSEKNNFQVNQSLIFYFEDELLKFIFSAEVFHLHSTYFQTILFLFNSYYSKSNLWKFIFI